MGSWKMVLELDSKRKPVKGSPEELREAIKRGADLRLYTEFRYNEHLDVTSDNDEVVQETSDFRVTYLVDNRWTAGIMNLRMPINPPEGFGPRPSMSFFMYNEDGTQAIARPFLDGKPPDKTHTRKDMVFDDMPKYHTRDVWDEDTNAPSSNFVYDFDVFQYWVNDEWEEVLTHKADGRIIQGALEALIDAFVKGREIKVGIKGLCGDLKAANEPGNTQDEQGVPDHEVFIQTGPSYYCTRRRIFSAGTHPLIRVRPSIPMQYGRRNWDFGWLMIRNDGMVARWLCDPFDLKFKKSRIRSDIRWFVR